MSEVRIEMTAPGRAKVIIDGVEIPRVESVSFYSSGLTEMNRVVLVVIADRVVATGPAEVKQQASSSGSIR